MPVAIVTGATRGIGHAIAATLLEAGFSLAICGRDKPRLQQLQSEWNEKYPAASILALDADLSNKEELTAFADTVLANFSEINMLVNNAGAFMPGSIAAEPEGALEQLMAINLYSAYHLTRRLLPVMKGQPGGHIFNICSVASLRAYPNGGAYSISKYALLGFSDNLREELKPAGIKVTAICPGATYTSSWTGSGVAPERIMEAGDVADALLGAYRLSPQACVEKIVMRPLAGDL